MVAETGRYRSAASDTPFGKKPIQGFFFSSLHFSHHQRALVFTRFDYGTTGAYFATIYTPSRRKNSVIVGVDVPGDPENLDLLFYFSLYISHTKKSLAKIARLFFSIIIT